MRTPIILRPVAEVAAVAEKIVAELRDELGALLPAAVVEHVGATSLPFGVTKGDVDVAVSVRVGEFDDAVGMLRSRRPRTGPRPTPASPYPIDRFLSDSKWPSLAPPMTSSSHYGTYSALARTSSPPTTPASVRPPTLALRATGRPRIASCESSCSNTCQRLGQRSDEHRSAPRASIVTLTFRPAAPHRRVAVVRLSTGACAPVTPPLFVVVSGPPASGKSTLAPVLARELGAPLVSKDTIKDALMSMLPVPDVEASRQIGRAAVAAMLAVAADSPIGAVIESNFYRSVAVESLGRLPGRLVEIFCRCDQAVAHNRHQARAGTRHAGHFDGVRIVEELWNDEVAEPVSGGWPVMEVDTNASVDMEEVLAFVRASIS